MNKVYTSDKLDFRLFCKCSFQLLPSRSKYSHHSAVGLFAAAKRMVSRETNEDEQLHHISFVAHHYHKCVNAAENMGLLRYRL